MNNCKFGSALKNVNNLIDRANALCVHSAEELDCLTLAEVKAKINQARSLQGEIDKLLTAELYHIIGMSDMTKDQVFEFLSRVRILSNFRPYLKPLATSSINIIKIPEDTEYKCTVSGLTLKVDLDQTKLKFREK